jgi:glutathione peroxidase-family protein
LIILIKKSNMRKLIIVVFTLLPALLPAQGIYNFSVPRIEGGTQALSALQGKKLLIITLPVTQSASADSMLQSIDTMATARAAVLQVLAVPSYEDGFTAAQRTALKNWYRSKLSNTVIIADGLRTRKTSGSQQHALFQWLTKAVQNGVFHIDVTGPGHKFFIKPGGQLFGVLLPQSKIWGVSVQRQLAK